MNVISLKCPNCGGELEVEDGLDTFYCKYCGHKIVLDGQSEYVIKAKVDIERMKHEERMYQMREENADKATKQVLKIIAAFLLFGFVLLFVAGLLGVLMK